VEGPDTDLLDVGQSPWVVWPGVLVVAGRMQVHLVEEVDWLQTRLPDEVIHLVVECPRRPLRDVAEGAQ